MFQFTAESIQEVLNSIHEALFIHDYETGKVLYVNNRMCELYNCTYEQALNDETDEFSLGKPPYSAAEAIHYIQKAKKNGEQVFEWIARKKSGETFWSEVSLRIAVIDKEKQGKRIKILTKAWL